MSIIGNIWPTLLDVSKQFGADGQPLPLAELLTLQNPVLDDIPWFEANGVNGHRMSARSGLPSAAWRKLNGGVPASKSSYTDVTESVGMLTARGVCDAAQARLSTNVAQFRMNESRGFLQAMNNSFVDTLFYGDTDVNPEQFLGFAPRFDSTTAENGPQIIDAGGTGTDLASIWLIGWGSEGAFGLYPKGSQAGLIHKDLGEDLEDAPDGSGKLLALRDWYEWHGGIGVKDWRKVVRIANIEQSLLTKSSASTDLVDLMVAALEQADEGDVRYSFYMPRKVRSYLRRQITNKDNVWLSMGEVAGRKVVQFDGVPCRRADALLLNESEVL
jgi:hypothetical protein